MSRRSAKKAVGYVVHQGNLLVFTLDDFPMEVTGVPVPAGSIAEGESPADAVVREGGVETGLTARIVRSPGVESYGTWPAKPEVHERHFFQLELVDPEVPDRWKCGEEDPSDGGQPVSWTCWWMALRDAHALCAGFGALEYNLYKLYSIFMTSATLSQFRNQQSDYIAAAQRGPVEITSHGASRRAVVVSPEFFDPALQALEDQADIRAAVEARKEPRIPFEDQLEELGR